MRASELPFQSYKSKRISSYPLANLICSSAFGPKKLKNIVSFLPYSVRVKRFLNNISKMLSVCAKIPLIEPPLSNFGSNRTNSLWDLVLYSVRFKWKTWFEKTALSMSIRRVIYYFRLKRKISSSLPIFNVFQWFLFYVRDFIWINTLTEKSKLGKKIVDLKVSVIQKRK